MADTNPILLTTTGTLSPVPINDLGKIPGFIHPTASEDLTEQFRLSELIASDDLQSAVDSGYIILRDQLGNLIDNIRLQLVSSIGVENDGVPLMDWGAILNFLGGVGLSTGATGGRVNIKVPTAEEIISGITGIPVAVAQADSEEEASTTSSTSFVNKMSLGWVPNGTSHYLIEWYFEHTVETASRLIETRIEIDDTFEIGADVFEASSANAYSMRSGWLVTGPVAITGPQGATGRNIDMDFRRFPGGGGNATVKIRRARIKVSEISGGGIS